MITILFADPAESRGFRRRHAARWRDAISLLHTGMGPEQAGKATRSLLLAHAPDAIVSAGFAAGLSGSMPPGSLFFGTPWSDPDWIGRLTALCPAVSPARLATTSRVLGTREMKSDFARITGAAAADMETEAIAEVAREAGIPLLSLRIVSDGHAEPLPNALVAAGAASGVGRITAFARETLRSPGEWLRIAGMLRRFAQLSDALGRTLDGVLSETGILPCRKNLEPPAPPTGGSFGRGDEMPRPPTLSSRDELPGTSPRTES